MGETEEREMVTRKVAYSDNTIGDSSVSRVGATLAPDFSLVVIAYCGDTIARVIRYSGRRASTAQLYTRLYQEFPLASFIHYASSN